MTETITPADQEKTFHLFSRLPAELRWKIWAFNLPGPRIVSIKCGPESLSSLPGLDSGGRFSPSSSSGCTSPAAIPTNLHVCHESRREALRQYRSSFGIARQPGQVFFAPDQDVLYFGPRDGFMASEANLRTILSMCDPAELAQIKRVAINDALFWVYENSWHHQARHQLPPPPPPPPPQHQHSHQRQHQHQQHPSALAAPLPPLHPPPAAAAMTHTAIAASLLIDVLRLIQSRLPGLQELIFIPRDENPLYSGDSCLVEPAMVQGRMARQIREAMTAVFGAPDDGPWRWRIMTLSADPDPPVYEKQVLGAGFRTKGGGGMVGDPSRCGRGIFDIARKDVCRGPTTRLGVLQESVRRRFMEMEMEMELDGCGQ
ncbi:hypothetical protein VP1G_09406 [Cytospora mali]|uniref:2EXR domain-containing protein n=1 Tax=Cytospora mali TaxID=578113 RepID=A0A194VEG8_CYTMA|nr:hypothetical protein VP1G_09406 [Valsa mali var. pyri (nom. inval.)]